jgi:hypothetical protein
VPEWAFNGMKWFGSGIIVATAFIHVGHLRPGICARFPPGAELTLQLSAAPRTRF